MKNKLGYGGFDSPEPDGEMAADWGVFNCSVDWLDDRICAPLNGEVVADAPVSPDFEDYNYMVL